MASSALLIILALLTACPASSASKSFQVLPRKTFNSIVCYGELPPSFPPPISHSLYTISSNPLYALCAAHESNGQNAGCFCESPTAIPRCREGLTENPSIFHAFNALCVRSCACRDVQEAPQINPARRSHVIIPRLPYDYTLGFMYGINPTEDPFSKGLPARAAPLKTRHRARCRGSCTHADGGCGENPSCLCKARPDNQYLDRGNPAFFLGSCISQSSIAIGGKAKRDLDSLPCPCNASYVSLGCCNAPEGLVREAAEHKLGVLTESKDP